MIKNIVLICKINTFYSPYGDFYRKIFLNIKLTT